MIDMKKLLLSLTFCFFVIFNSSAQVVDYLIPAADLINMVPQSGDMCWDPNEYKQASVGNTWGFQWMSTNGGTPTSINIDWVNVSDEGVSVVPYLNGNVKTPFTSTGNVTCAFTGELFSIDPANYNPLGLNTVLLDYSAATTLVTQLYPVAGSYVHVEVTYGASCTDPDVPTLTASSPVCPGSNVTINIAGNLNDATGWVVYNDACGGTMDGGTITSTYVASPAATTTYYIRGEGGCVTPGACGSITITVEDTQAPVPDNATLSDVNAECTASPSAPTATDNCAGTVSGTPDVTFPITAQGTTTVTWTYDDGNGNTSTQTQDVILNDVTAPVPDNGTLSDVTAECSATPTAPTATDNCVGSVTATPDVSFPITTQGTTAVTWTYDDGNGNTSTQTQDVVLNDVTAPVPDNGTLSDVTAECSATPIAPTATDNCVGSVTGTPDVTFPITTQGTTTVTWTYDDGNGNTSTQTQDVVIDDVTDPVINNCPGNSTFPADNAGCTAQIIWIAPFATDNCGGVTLTSTHNSGDTFPLGTTTVVYTATDDAGNTSQCSFDITVTSDLAVNAVVTDLTCFGNNSGAIDASVSGGTSPYSYDWNSGSYTTEDLTGIPAGNYNLTVTDANGCTATTSETVSEPSEINISVDTEINPTGCGMTDGSIGVTVSGGTPSYSYDWNSGAYTTEDLSGVGAGAYILIVTDGNGCTGTANASLSDPGAPVVVIDSTFDATCFGSADGAIYITALGGTTPYSYDWNSGAFSIEDITGLSAGNYSLTLTDDGGCTASINHTINEPAALDVTVSQNGAELTANATGVSYQWINCATMSPIAGETNAVFTATNNGDYAVIITDGSCSDTSICYTVGGIGFEEIDKTINIYPNPSDGLINVEIEGFNQSTFIQVYDLGGKIVYQENTEMFNQVITLDLSFLEKGTYILTENSNDKIYTSLIIIH